jgi:alkylated DNA repair dioxygenase AlkB
MATSDRKRKGDEETGARDAKKRKIVWARPGISVVHSESPVAEKLALCGPERKGLYAWMPHYFDKIIGGGFFHWLMRDCVFEQGQVTMYDPKTKTHKLYDEPRLTAYHGPVDYTYAGKTMAAKPMTEVMVRLLNEVEELCGKRPEGALFNLYRDGKDYISWHKDKEDSLDPTMPIFSFSFGATRDFQVKFSRAEDGIMRGGLTPEKATGVFETFALESGSLFVMYPGFQQMFHHCVPKRLRCKEPRINVTVRFLKRAVSE